MKWKRVTERYREGACFNETARRRWVTAEANEVEPDSRVLDVGAGRGIYRDLFAHCTYSTQDFAQEPSTVGHYTELDYVSDIASIPVTDSSFDVILCTEVLEHVPDPASAIEEFARILRPGGRLLLSAPLGSILHQEPFHYYGGFTPHWYRKFLGDAGFDSIEVEPNRGFFGLFAQESLRFSSLVGPRPPCQGTTGLVLRTIWLLTIPGLRLLIPLTARYLDGLGLEQTATVGYHVKAFRRPYVEGQQ